MRNSARNATDFFIHVLLALVCLVTVFPFYMVVVAAFTPERDIVLNGFSFYPRAVTLDAFRFALSKGSLLVSAYQVTITITVIGTAISVILTCMLAYVIAQSHLRWSKWISLFVYLPFLFNGGLVPFYILLVKLGFKNSLLGLIVPMLLNSFHVFLMVNYFRGLPKEVMESAKIDGAAEFTIFRKIALPLSLPAIATITLFILLSYWNDWFLSLLLIDEPKLYPLQFLLRQIISNSTFISTSSQSSIAGPAPAESAKMATVLLTIGPILIAYPYLQKYFIKGISMGAVKG